MYPQRELSRLADCRAALRRDIARHRAQCAQSAAGALRPLRAIDRVLEFRRRFSPLAPFAAAAIAPLVTRAVFPRVRILRSLALWGPLVLGAARAAGIAARRFGAAVRA